VDVGNWSKRRHKVNERVSTQQASSIVIGHTERYDDTLTNEKWALLISSKAGQVSGQIYAGDDPEYMILELAALCHSFLESIDRRREKQGGR
jgi:hypothetical protein